MKTPVWMRMTPSDHPRRVPEVLEVPQGPKRALKCLYEVEDPKGARECPHSVGELWGSWD